MKRIFTFLLVAAVFAACSEVNDDPKPVVCPDEHYALLSFEASEGLKDNAGKSAVPGDIELFNGEKIIKHSNVFWAENYATDGAFDGILFTTVDGGVKFGSTYSSDPTYGEFWGGFVLSANYDRKAVELDYANQFAAWAGKGVNGSSTCLIGYDCSYVGGPAYAMPAIEFTAPVSPCHVFMTNTAVTLPYTPIKVAANEYVYKVVVIGSLAGTETGRIEVELATGLFRTTDWTRVDLTSLNKVDCLKFKSESNDRNDFGSIAPAYFAIDDLGYTKTE